MRLAAAGVTCSRNSARGAGRHYAIPPGARDTAKQQHTLSFQRPRPTTPPCVLCVILGSAVVLLCCVRRHVNED